jgi:LysR family hydrogen peroxide-inducible transcriptional activator
MELHQLRYFLALARSGSFVRAAEEEGVTQPSLSQQIKKLEQDVGHPLFDRLGRGVRLTRFGEALLPQAIEMVRLAGETRKRIEALDRPDAGTVVVGAIPTVLPYALAPALAGFHAAYPLIEVQIRENTTERLLDELRRGEVDLAVIALPVKQPELVCSELFREPLLAAVPPRHPFSQAASLSLPALASERMLLLREGHCLRDDALAACRKARAEFEAVFETDHLASIFSLVEHGFGVSLVPRMASKEAGTCRLIPVDTKPMRRIGYTQVRGHFASPAQRQLIEFLRRWAWSG